MARKMKTVNNRQITDLVFSPRCEGHPDQLGTLEPNLLIVFVNALVGLEDAGFCRVTKLIGFGEAIIHYDDVTCGVPIDFSFIDLLLHVLICLDKLGVGTEAGDWGEKSWQLMWMWGDLTFSQLLPAKFLPVEIIGVVVYPCLQLYQSPVHPEVGHSHLQSE
jgi:hypothetical protein